MATAVRDHTEPSPDGEGATGTIAARQGMPRPGRPWRPVPAEVGDWFDPVEVARGRAYHRPLERLGRIRAALGTAVIVAFVAGEAAPRLVVALAPASWVVELVVVVVAMFAATLVYAPWFAAHRSLFYDRRWGLSTQTPRGFLVDQAKQLAVGVVASLIVLVPLYAVLRSTAAWWLPGGS